MAERWEEIGSEILDEVIAMGLMTDRQKVEQIFIVASKRIAEAEDLLRYWVKKSGTNQWEKTDVARNKTLDYFDKQARAGEEK